jgi:hypothetical protein
MPGVVTFLAWPKAVNGEPELPVWAEQKKEMDSKRNSNPQVELCLLAGFMFGIGLAAIPEKSSVNKTYKMKINFPGQPGTARSPTS